MSKIQNLLAIGEGKGGNDLIGELNRGMSFDYYSPQCLQVINKVIARYRYLQKAFEEEIQKVSC